MNIVAGGCFHIPPPRPPISPVDSASSSVPMRGLYAAQGDRPDMATPTEGVT
jgi:hypothetical protein